MSELNNFKITHLRKIARYFNDTMKIKAYSKLSQTELLTELNKHLHMIGDQIFLKEVENKPIIIPIYKRVKPKPEHNSKLKKLEKKIKKATNDLTKFKSMLDENIKNEIISKIEYGITNKQKNKIIREMKKRYNNEFNTLNDAHEDLNLELENMREMIGNGLFSSIKNIANKVKDKVINTVDKVKDTVSHVFNKASKYNNISRKTLEQYGDIKISTIQVFRTPLKSIISKFLNSTKYGYDSFFHLALVVTVNYNNMSQNIIIEKNEVINISTSYKKTDKTEVHNINFNQDISLFEFIDKAPKSVSSDKWFTYDAFLNNCQCFLKYILTANNLYNTDTANFVFQDLTELIKDQPKIVGKIANFVTDTAGVISRITGKGSAKNRLMKFQDEIRFINDVLKYGSKKERLQFSQKLNNLI